MKLYTAKTLEDALKQASQELNIPVESIVYRVTEEKSGFLMFGKKVTIAIDEIEDIIEFAENYIKDVCHELTLEASVKTFYKEDLIKILIETDHNSVLIGNNGTSLQALNELVKLAVSSKYGAKYRILLDIGNYKDKKYYKVIAIAKRAAKEVLHTHVDIQLNPMTPDERKKVHNALSTWKGIKTESVGDGKNRAIVIKYIGGDFKKPRRSNKHLKEENAPVENVEVETQAEEIETVQETEE